jgi:hypothetical protein
MTLFEIKQCAIVWLLTAFWGLTSCALWGEQKCTHIHIELNGASIPAPRMITLRKTNGSHPITVTVNDGCFRLPKVLRNAESIDVTFQTNQDNIHLIAREPSSFDVGWKLILKDDAKGPFAAFKNVPAKEICVVEFETGGDGTAIIQPACRSPLKTDEAGRVPHP